MSTQKTGIQTKSPKANSRRSKGFALVVTLSLMILLTLIAVGLLSLSSITLRSVSQNTAQAEARANARLAMMLAIGELQKQMGPDQRVSANGAIISNSAVANPHWTGVWDSWKAGATEPSQHSTITPPTNPPAGVMAPTYDTDPGRPTYFRSWLLSLTEAEARNPLSPSSLALAGTRTPGPHDPGNPNPPVELVGKGSLGATAAAADYVSARLLSVKSKTSSTAPNGRYGWWIGDESQKARIMEDSYNSAPAQNLAEKIFRQQAPGSTGTTTVKGLEALTEQEDKQLKSLPSLQTVNLVNGATGKPAENFHSITPFSYNVLADVREGGLKRDLSTLLERPIVTTESQDPFMLYRFDNAGQERVPIQDLAAFYQLYDSSRDSLQSKGVRYTSSPQNNLLTKAIQVAAPDFGNKQSQDQFLREYTKLYRSPVPIKIQMVVSMKADKIPDADRNTIIAADPSFSDTHFLRLGIIPSVTFWNPTNVPIVMNLGDPEKYSQMLRLSYLPFYIKWKKSNGYTSLPVNLSWAAIGGGTEGTVSGKPAIFTAYFSATREVVFQPGEVRVFSYPYRAGTFDFHKNSNENFKPFQEMFPGWDSTAFLQMGASAPARAVSPTAPDPLAVTDNKNVKNKTLTFKATDSITVEVGTGEDYNRYESAQAEVQGAGMQFFVIQKSHQSRDATTGTMWNFRNYQLTSRMGSGQTTEAFNASLMKKGFPGGTSPILFPTRSMQSLIDLSDAGEDSPFLQFALMAGTETSDSAATSNGGALGGRKFASRPFIHSTPIAPPVIDKDDKASLYNYGWNWWVEEVNTGMEASVQTNIANSEQGYYGGGYTPESGTTHVIQQEIPVVPPMSIASLSHAQLGGFSLSNEAMAISGPTAFQRVTAIGASGLFPHTLQAIGNSYAHPNIPPDKAFSEWKRIFNANAGEKTLTIADHSYLANKALWDEFFFSSISPQPSAVEVFGSSTSRTVSQVAGDFFLREKPLPNRRITPFIANFGEAKLNTLLGQTQTYTGGMADKIGSHLMVEGPFNVNSTSVEAWKVFLSSLKGKPVAYLDKDNVLTAGVELDEFTPAGTPVGSFTLPNGKPYQGSSSNPSDADQWASWRELTTTEVDELATAIVTQVKRRGPFLSLSEFVNRRLDSANEEFSVKGALQAALDDPAVSINSGFRNNPAREFTGDEIPSSDLKFKKALAGPIAYGSAAYVDQADVLRNFSEQLTPRGDTFIIRTYGDSLDASGRVQARAWCETVVQRVPEYIDPVNEAHVKQTDLTSSANKTFGRKFQIVSFRWLGASEV